MAFKILNMIAFLGWIAIIFVPGWKVTGKIVKSGILSLTLAFAYVTALFIAFPVFQNGGGFNSITEVRAIFASDWGLLAGWVHYLCFDLLIGCYVLEALSKYGRVTRGIVLLLTFMFGPLGWICAEILKKFDSEERPPNEHKKFFSK